MPWALKAWLCYGERVTWGKQGTFWEIWDQIQGVWFWERGAVSSKGCLELGVCGFHGAREIDCSHILVNETACRGMPKTIPGCPAAWPECFLAQDPVWYLSLLVGEPPNEDRLAREVPRTWLSTEN